MVSSVEGEPVAFEEEESKAINTVEQNSKSGDTNTKTNVDVQWDNTATDFDSDEDWVVDEFNKESPGTWDPNQFEQQAPGDWKETKGAQRVQDLPSPSLAEPEPDQRRLTDSEEEWPFTSPCKMEEKRSKRGSAPVPPPRPDNGEASDIDSDEEPPNTVKSDKFGAGGGEDKPLTASRHADEEDDTEDKESEGQDDSARSSGRGEPRTSVRRGRRRDQGPAMPRRSRGARPEAEDEESGDQPPKQSTHDGDENGEAENETAETLAGAPDQPAKPRRRGSRREEAEAQEDGLNQGSFHKLTTDFDKKPSRSNSRGRRTRTPGSAGRRRKPRAKGVEQSGPAPYADDAGDAGEEEQEVKLKGDEDGTPGSGRRTWRERRAQNRQGQQMLQAPGSGGRRPVSSQQMLQAPGSAGRRPVSSQQMLQAPGSGGRRPASRRTQMRRASSERWMRTVEGVEVGDGGADLVSRARNVDPNKELSRSAHGIKRYHSGGVGRMATGLGTASYHGGEARRTPQQRRATRKAAVLTPETAEEGGDSYEDDYEYELNLSARSARTLDSIEDLEDFEHIDFQTPGMVDYDEEILELMQRANPEHTAQLNRRVHRKRDAVNYDQNMPAMTRQALLTRTASTQVMKQYVDGSSIDRRRLMVRSMSNSSMTSGDELSMSQHRQQFGRGTPGRRPPPRTRSSGMAALSRSEHPGYGGPPRPAETSDDRRRLFRTKSTSTSSFRHNQKPNRVASLQRRPPGEQAEGGSATRGAPDERRGSLSRAKSMHAAVGRHGPRSLSPKKPERRVPKSAEKKPKNEYEATDKDEFECDSHGSEDSDVDSDDDAPLVKPKRPVVPRATPPKPPERKKADKRDFTIRRNRSKLHSILYEVKMGVDMKDLFKQVQQGEMPRSPIKTLMMPSP